MIDMNGSRVVITGAGGGVGRALCTAFGSAGAALAGCDLDRDQVPDGCDERHGFDLRDDAAVARAAGQILAGGVPDVVISNAGWTRAELIDQLDPGGYDDEMARNLGGAAKLCLALLPAMRRDRGARSFVFIASVNAQAHFGNPAYAAAKAGMLAWMRAIAAEAGADGVRANAVVPASIRTAAWDHRLEADPGILDRVSRLYPLGRLVTPEEVANAALFLASPLASGITGAALNVDAGLMAGNLPFVDALSNLEP
ncbi:SDR family NAD(P)-dependent oxidoreductase [Pukyongiella litopenaei]|uniref:SDR family oxidoreductase n=1 Tax=Pukyongiella litopenaei TaxID=2605946 RepID=A0A2S0ML71_9RHOB|nr:SDR family oxidoreductase [Pukyongiella litopenaei]AVO36630.1 SDR family oxidoreductase [Pukyongiella litopenaei]